jgi:RNA polymerase sigma-70 factor (ECF subfamily)
VTVDQVQAQSRALDSPQSFAEWVEPHLVVMAHIAARLAGEADRDDIVQDAIIRAWKKRHQYTPARGPARSWLIAITADQARRARRRRRNSVPLIEDAGPVRSLDGRIDLLSAVARLAPRQRLAVDTFYFAGLSVAETALVMACAEGTVKSTLSDARKQLRVFLGDDDG